MQYRTCLAAVIASLLPLPSMAEVPRVVTDIPPVHSIASMVMGDLGQPDLILSTGASPHGYAMLPSQATKLSSADLVIWMGSTLTPWLDRSIKSLAVDTRQIALLDSPATNLLGFRESATFAPHDHDASDDHDAGQHSNDADLIDPHAWLDPRNAHEWLDLIADELAEADSENSGAYRSNAKAAQEDLAKLTTEIAQILAPVRGKRFIVFHDAFHYFEAYFDFEASGAISLSDASSPGPARLAEIRDLIDDLDVTCIFVEPQFDPARAAAATQGTDVRTGVLDPLGSELDPGPDLYPRMLTAIASEMADCLASEK